MKSIFKKLLFVALGIALSALLLEAGLQLRAWHIRHSLHTQVKHTLSAKDKITILCIGESTTDNQWPRFLNQALLDAGITKEVRVIDRGVGGTTTGIILQNITYYIEKYNPDIIVAMMGINDTEDYIPFTRNTRLKTVKLFHRIWGSRCVTLPAGNICYNYKNFNDYRYIQSEVPYKLSQKLDALVQLHNQKKHCKAISLFLSLLEEYNEHFLSILEHHPINLDILSSREEFTVVAQKAMALYNYDVSLNPMLFYYYAMKTQNEEMFTQVIKHEPLALLGVQAIRLNFPNIYERIISEFLPANILTKKNHVLGLKAWHYVRLQNFQTAKKYFNKITRFYMNNINPATQKNYLALADIAKANNIIFVAMQYPVRSVKPLKAMLAGRPEIIFVSNEKNFKQALRIYSDEELFFNLFAGDFGHTTDLSDKIIADNLARTLANIIQ